MEQSSMGPPALPLGAVRHGGGRFVELDGRKLRTLTLIPACVALNIVMGQVVALVKLPIYLDSVGTVLVAALAGPLAGVLAGVFTEVLWTLLANPTILPFALTAATIGLCAGVFSKAFRTWPTALLAGLLTGVLAAFVSAPIAWYCYGGVTGGGTDFVVALFRFSGNSPLIANLKQGLAVDPVDKMLSFGLAWTVLAALPRRYLDRFA
ncbi:MAG: ECF transporter S component [Candidatus Xenobia bacterium]